LVRRRRAFAAFGHHEMAMPTPRFTVNFIDAKQPAEYGSSGAEQYRDRT